MEPAPVSTAVPTGMIQSADRALRVLEAVGSAPAGLTAHQAADAPIYLALFRDREIVIADVVDSPCRPRVHQLDVGLHESPHATAFGKVMLAALDKQVRDAELARRGLPALTRSSVTDVRRLDEQLAKVRREGLAVEVDEFIPKLACVASPIRRADGVVIGAASASVPSAEFSRRRARLERAVRHGAVQVTRVMARSHR